MAPFFVQSISVTGINITLHTKPLRFATLKVIFSGGGQLENSTNVSQTWGLLKVIG